jgi:serine/threonine protein kinase
MAEPPVSDERVSHYRLIGLLGRGAMGEVYRAVDERLGRPVALKLLQPAQTGSADMQARLLREAQAASALNHPGIVTVHDVGAFQGRVFMVMEFVEGERLSDVARRGVDIDEALRLVAEAADALGAAHQRNILHRDVKSDNLMRTPDGRVKVLDFGLAKLRETNPGDAAAEPAAPLETLGVAETLATPSATPTPAPGPTSSTPSTPLALALESGKSQPGITPSADLTMAGQLVGTPAYMSPEQAEGLPADAQSEVWSLGVVLYELLVGKRPFDRATITDTLGAVRSAQLVPPSVAAPARKIPPGVDKLIARALTRPRSMRTADMRSFAAEARGLMREAGRLRRLLSLALVGGVIVAVGAALASWLAARQPGPQTAVTQTRRITFDAGCEEYPSFSPDGKTIYFDGLVNGDYEVQALDLASGKKRQLTHDVGWDYGSSVSPDGKWLAYVHLGDQGRELRVIPSEGGTPLPLGPSLSFPAWCADGGLLVSPRGDRVVRWDPGAQFLPPAPQPHEIGRLPSGSVLRYLGQFTDGEVVAFWQPQEHETEFVLGAVTSDGTPRVYERGLTVDQLGLYISPGQDALYYGHHASSANELLRRPRKRGVVEVVPSGVSTTSGFSISHDGKRLVYSSCRESQYLMRIRPGRPPEPLMPHGTWRDRFPLVLDERSVLYISDRAGPDQAWMLDLKSGESRALTDRSTVAAAASHDGNMLVYVDGAAHGLSIVPLAGGPARRLTHDATDALPRWSADDKRVVFVRTGADGQRIYTVPAEGGEPKPLTGAGATYPEVSPAGFVAYLQNGPSGKTLMRINLDGSDVRQLSKTLAPGEYANPRFSPDGKRITIVHKMTEVFELVVDGDKPAELRWKTDTDGIDALTYAPDGNGYIAAIASWDGDLWIADGKFP